MAVFYLLGDFLSTVIYSMNNVTILLVFAAALTALYMVTKRPNGIPPGPVRWPFIGNLPSLIGRDVIGIFNNLRTKYGDVYSLYIGSELNIVITGYDVIHDALIKKGSVFLGRPKQHANDTTQIVFSNGQLWKDNRAFLMKSFNELCHSSNGANLQGIITDELNHFIKELDKSYLGVPFDPAPRLLASVSNIMFRICHGHRADYEDPKFKWYIDHIDRQVQAYARHEVSSHCFPFFRYLPGDLLHEQNLREETVLLKNYYQELQQNAPKLCSDALHWNLSAFLKREESPVAKEFEWAVIHELVAAGSDTTSATMTWFVLMMIKHPDVQQRLYEEIVHMAGTDRAPMVSQKPHMPFTEAVLLESIRMGSVVPFSVPRRVLQEVNLRGYTIPSGTTILPILSSVHFDPTVFPDPMTFNPGRFLSDDGRKVVNTERMIAFSIGKRSCLGETIARTELFLYVTTLVQRYEFKAVKDEMIQSSLGESSLIRKPKHFRIILEKRTISEL